MIKTIDKLRYYYIHQTQEKMMTIPQEIEVYCQYDLTIRSLINKLVNVLEMNDIDDARVSSTIIKGYYGDIEGVELRFTPLEVPKRNDTGHTD